MTKRGPSERLRDVRALPADRSACPALLAAAGDPSPDVARAALERLARLGGAEEAARLRAGLIDADLGLVPDVARTLRALGDERAAAVALAALREPRLSKRLAAATALRELVDPRARDALLGALRDPIAGVRRLAAGGLARLGEDELTERALARLLDDTDAWVRAAAVEALAAVAADPDLRLEPALADPEPSVRRVLARLAGRLGRGLVTPLHADTPPHV
ncbi:MAG: HEAT repeat domain-containing protein, partial [Gaiellaceae bacterium]